MKKKLFILFKQAEQKKMFALFVGTILMGFIEVAGVASIAPFMTVVSNPEMIYQNQYLNTFYNEFGFANEKQFLVVLGCCVVAMLAISNGYAAFMNWCMTFFSAMQGHRLSERLLRQYLSQPYIFFLNRNTADLGKNILSEVNRIIGGVILPAMLSLSKVVIALFLLALLLVIDPFLAIRVILILGGFYCLIFFFVRHYLHSIGVASTQVVLERFKLANEAMSGIKDLKLRSSEEEFIKRFSVPSEANAKYSAKSSLISSLPRYALEPLAFGGIVTIIIYLIANDQTSGEIIPLISLYALAGYRLMPALQQIYLGLTQIRYNLPALDILVDDLSSPGRDRVICPVSTHSFQFEDELELKSIYFYYPEMKDPVINGLDLKIQPNTTIGIVGSTGSGKTTLIDILLGLLSPESGELLVDGVTLTNTNISGWQQKIGYVPQTIYLTDDTIARNIAFAVPDDKIDMKAVKEAAKLSELDGFIQTLGEGYHTFVGERGVRLSGGQRQRIGIARALYHRPKVLVLDEATSSLDGITENVIMQAIQNLSHKKTIITIAHRLATVKECDIIYMMEKGGIVESGTYNKLITTNKQFQGMANA